MPSTALMWERNAFPKPAPVDAPFINPAMSVMERTAGTLLFGLWCWTSHSQRSSGTETLASLGSIVQKGKFSAGTLIESLHYRKKIYFVSLDWSFFFFVVVSSCSTYFNLVKRLKRVDFPTLGRLEKEKDYYEKKQFSNNLKRNM